jgi:hypothetical protein
MAYDIEFIQSKQAASNTDVIAAFDTPLTAGDLVVIVIGVLANDSTVTPVQVTDYIASPVELSHVMDFNMAGESGSAVHMYAGYAVGGETHFEVYQTSRATVIAMVFRQVQYGPENADKTSGFDTSAYTPSCGTSYNRNLVVAGFIHDKNADGDVTDGFTGLSQWDWFFLGAGYLIRQSDGSSVSSSWGMDDGGEWATVIASWGADDDPPPPSTGAGNFFLVF